MLASMSLYNILLYLFLPCAAYGSCVKTCQSTGSY